jgi:hypothetical protein
VVRVSTKGRSVRCGMRGGAGDEGEGEKAAVAAQRESGR